jgi:hypothetical protein
LESEVIKRNKSAIPVPLPVPEDRLPVRGKDLAVMMSRNMGKEENTFMEGASVGSENNSTEKQET